ncbi:cardiolipin synthase [Amaricoccus sp.]|uniref:cardiolipin synthase n=1 Tax=Amaricoccus sp. TaxID=1872485 RepID=UPI0025C3269C|nr:cardiolipin synthase [Amaricoccus sp.]
MSTPSWLWHLGHVPGYLVLAIHVALQVFFIGRALLRPEREPAARMAWVVVILVAPVVGLVLYVLFGEPNIGRRRIARLRAALARLPAFDTLATHEGEGEAAFIVPNRLAPLFRVGESISGFPVVGGNTGALMASSDAAIDAMIADIDAATEHVHLMFYIWLPDGNGLKMVEAVKRAARRGVPVRAMADDLGSRLLIRSPHWKDMAAAGVRVAAALPVGFPLSRPLKGRIDMRNHRKILVVDNRVTYCGSQNCADPAFAIKAKYAPWVDAMMRFEGPIVRQNQHLFASDWMAHTSEDLSALVAEPVGPLGDGFPAQVIGTSAATRPSAMPEMFEALMYAARREMVATTPYYVPDEPIQAALCASARRGVATTLILPARNDSWIVAAASHSYYGQLLEAGVRIFEFLPGLLHTKSLIIDGEVTLIGSANMDRRSFELNSENNILLFDKALSRAMRARQDEYIAQSKEVDRAEVEAWSLYARLRNNAIAMFGPVL